MRVVAAVSFFFLLNGLSALAQYPPPQNPIQFGAVNTVCETHLQPQDGHHPKGSTESSCVTVSVPGCPIGMSVHQRMGGSTLAVDANGTKRKVFAQRLRLFLNDLRPDSAGQKIVSATVTVHGTSTKPRMQSLSSSPGASSGSMAKALHVDLSHWNEPGVSGDFLLPGFTSASRVDLESVTYDDGTVWKLSGNQTCRVAPDPLMLINR